MSGAISKLSVARQRTAGFVSRPLLLGAVFAALAVASVPVARLVAAAKPAQISFVEGKAQRASAKGGPEDLKVGVAVTAGDTITTGEDARVELKFADASVLRVGPSAKLLLTDAHFNEGPAKRKMTVRLFFGNVWAKVTSIVSGDQKFAVETENAVAGVRGTTFRVDANNDKSVLVRVYAGAVAVAKPVPLYDKSKGRPGEREEVDGPQEISLEQWTKLVGAQMQIVIGADGKPGELRKFTEEDEKGDAWAQWNSARDEGKPPPPKDAK
jgi:FecR protein